MTGALPELTQDQARALAIHAQGLDAPRAASVDGLHEVFPQIGCVQLDPISHIARTQHLVLRNRAAHANIAALDADLRTLQFSQRRVFEFWAHCASLVLCEDFRVFAGLMGEYRDPDKAKSVWSHRAHAWMKTNRALRDTILREIRRNGPMPSSAFEDSLRDGWQSSGWNSGRNVSKMIDHLWFGGRLTVADRRGMSRLWDLTERVISPEHRRKPWSAAQIVRTSVTRAARALGVGTRQHIMQHFTRGRHADLDAALPRMVQRGELVALTVQGWAGTWYALPEALTALDQIDLESMPALALSPFDNLICDRKRTRLLFDFDFTIEIYVPPAKRKFGYYVLPLLHRGQLIGRVDSKFDKAAGAYRVERVFREPGQKWTRSDERAVRDGLDRLGAFLKAKRPLSTARSEAKRDGEGTRVSAGVRSLRSARE
jgi:uncharacterized protein